MPISELELWARASFVLNQRGERADEHIAERIAYLAERGDAVGVSAWRAIADRVDRLRDIQGAGKVRH